MILPDWQICDLMARENDPLEILPYDSKRVQPASYDVTLGTEFAWPDGKTRGCRRFELKPGAVALAHTAETVQIPADHAAILMGKSSWARKWVTVEQAGFIDPGFRGQIVLELHNAGPNTVILEAGVPIAQLVFYRLDGRAEMPYGSAGLGSHYQNQTGAKEAAW